MIPISQRSCCVIDINSGFRLDKGLAKVIVGEEHQQWHRAYSTGINDVEILKCSNKLLYFLTGHCGSILIEYQTFHLVGGISFELQPGFNNLEIKF